mmetsp:Transcript_91656/g.259611  ORF Transcript_91656/g.259611 Transcript_91656/m.259611 type:complete len:371 (-) Transcript_91656:42-1154(-)
MRSAYYRSLLIFVTLLVRPASVQIQGVPEDISDQTQGMPAGDPFYMHWGRLVPPCCHHPGSPTHPSEPALLKPWVAHAVSHWQAQPRLAAGALLAKAQQEPYFRGLPEPEPEPASERLPGIERGLEVFVHHRTGNLLEYSMELALKVKTEMSVVHVDPERTRHPDKKVIHFVRNPLDVILSGYRHHRNQFTRAIAEWGGGNQLQDPPCFDCDDHDHKAMFEPCEFDCSYFELLNRLEEPDGVAAEALSARRTLWRMHSQLATWADSPNVLTLTFDLWAEKGGRDRKTAACLLRFLGTKEDSVHLEAVRKSTHTYIDRDQVTQGLYDNSQLRKQLEEHPAWGPQFRATSALIRRSLEKQARIYGCPLPHGR